MAWTAPRTWSTGDTWDAADVNEQLRDNLIDVGSPPIGQAVISGTQPWGHEASETYTFRIEFNSLPIAKDCTLVSHQIVAGVAGIWEVSALIRYPATASATGSSLRGGKIYVNNVASAARGIVPNVLNVDAICPIPPLYVSVAAGAVFDLRGWQNSGGSLTLGAGTYLQAKLVYR